MSSSSRIETNPLEYMQFRTRLTGKPPIDWENDVLPEVKNIIAKYVPDITVKLTIRQIYYLLVSSQKIYHEKYDYGTFDSKMTEWREGRTQTKKKGKIAGYRNRNVEIDWGVIEDRARQVKEYDLGYPGPRHYIDTEINNLKQLGYYRRMWTNQPRYVEVWVEKDAMFSVFAPICRKYKVSVQRLQLNYSSI